MCNITFYDFYFPPENSNAWVLLPFAFGLKFLFDCSHIWSFSRSCPCSLMSSCPLVLLMTCSCVLDDVLDSSFVEIYWWLFPSKDGFPLVFLQVPRGTSYLGPPWSRPRPCFLFQACDSKLCGSPGLFLLVVMSSPLGLLPPLNPRPWMVVDF